MNNQYGLFINYEYCTGCHVCEVACKKVHDLPEGQYGIVLCEDGPRKNINGKWELTYLPLPTHLCDFCEERVKAGSPAAFITASPASWSMTRWRTWRSWLRIIRAA